MTSLEDRMYMAMLGVRPIVSATANVNPAGAARQLQLLDRAMEAYKRQKSMESPPEPAAHAAGE